MDCPACTYYDAYISLLWVYCRNPMCRYYDLKYDEKRTQEELGFLMVPETLSERLRRVREMWNGGPKGS